METYRFDAGPLCIGIDIGWSETRKSCAVAIQGLSVDDARRGWKQYANGNGRPVATNLFTLPDLIDEIPRMFAGRKSQTNFRTIIVVDGPVGAGGPPLHNRPVDRFFASGGFHRRMQPVPVEGGDGPTYVAATERVIQALCASFQMHRPQSLWNPAASSNFIVCETHPTVGLALCLPKQDPESLPTRKTARALPGTGFMIRAKSDWYWRLGAGKVVAEKAFDGNVMIANEVNHERVAGLYCLAVANAIGHHPASVLICGTKEGNYVFLDHTDESWAADVEGTKAYRDPIARNPSCAVGPTAASPLRTAVGVDPAAELVRHDDRQSECFEDDFDDFEDTVLVLADNGGVWERHNDWLNGHEEIITLVTLDTRRDLLLLCRSQREDGMQWTFVDGRQSPLGVARLRGFQHNHLSLENQCVIPVKVLADGVQVPG